MDYKILLLIAVTGLPILFWLWFYFKRIFVSKQLLFFTFAKGFIVFWAVLAIIELISLAFPQLKYWLVKFAEPCSLKDFALLYVAAFLIVAPLEEIIKFSVLKRTIFKAKEINQLIDGLQLGIVFGLGFASAENIFKFGQVIFSAKIHHLTSIFILRTSISTLALTIYSGLMGYYLGLALLHKFYRPFLLNKALVFPLLLHGLFNFLILLGTPELSVLLVAALSWLIYRWYRERRLFEIKLQEGKSPISLPFLSDTQEANIYYAKKKAPFDLIKKEKLIPKAKKTN